MKHEKYHSCRQRGSRGSLLVVRHLMRFIVAFLMCMVLCAGVYAGNDPVTAKFKDKKGKRIAVLVKASSPVPGSVIFTLKLPAGVKLEKASPEPGKYDTNRGEVKWLLRGLSPGTHKIKLSFSENVNSDDLQAEIRYLNSVTGKLSIFPVGK